MCAWLATVRERLNKVSLILTAPESKSAAKAIGTIIFSLYMIFNAPRWTQLAALVSPLFAVHVVFFFMLVVSLVWRHNGQDIKATVFRTAKYAWRGSQQLYRNYLINFVEPEIEDEEEEQDVIGKNQLNRQVIRTIVMLMMMQICLVPSSHFASIQMLIACRFLLDFAENGIYNVLELKEAWKETYGPMDNPDSGSPHGASNDPPRSIITCIAILVIQMFKSVIAVSLIYHQIVNVSILYYCITVFYVLLIVRFVEKAIRFCLEKLQLEALEGLESHYAKVFCGAVELKCASFFMIWLLVIGRQMVVLVALYTNIYTGGREFVNSTLSAACTELASLAMFERASRAELKELNDVCAICLAPMSTARKTKCNHYFHGRCLKRSLQETWLCPLCNKTLP